MKNTPVSLLIVDDDPVFAHFLRQLILSLGSEFACVAQWADSAEKAMVELRRVAYDLVLLDYHLPGADGLQLLAQIRELPADRRAAVIMLTGSGNETVAVEAMKRGASDYLPKAGIDAPPVMRALRNAITQKRLAEQIASYNAQMRIDLEMARHLQFSLLPDSYPAFPPSAAPTESAFRFCHRFFPASDLAGDFFSVLPISDTQAAVFVCDVMGHGVRSALVTAMVRALVDNAGARAADPGQFLSEMNRRLTTLLRASQSPMFATALYLVADAAKGRLSYATAGHPHPFHLQRRAGLAEPLQFPSLPGPALGLFDDAAYTASECQLTEGDVILAFTDGLFEATDIDGEEEYGQTRLLAAARDNLNLPPTQLCDALVAGVRSFAGGAPMADDVCLLSIEVAHLGATSMANDNPRTEHPPACATSARQGADRAPERPSE